MWSCFPLVITQTTTEREWEGGQRMKFRPLLSLHVPLSGSICQSTAESWQLPLPLVSLPPHHVIAADNTKAIVQSEKSLACTCYNRAVDSIRRQKNIYHQQVASRLYRNTSLLRFYLHCSGVTKAYFQLTISWNIQSIAKQFGGAFRGESLLCQPWWDPFSCESFALSL